MIAIFGLGRSGLATAKAAHQFGQECFVFDEKPESAFEGSSIVRELNELQIPIRFGFTNDFRGISQLVVSPGVAKFHPILKGALDMGIPIWSEIEFAYRISKAPIIAITGTNGKSTTTAMTYLALKEQFEPVLCGNIYGSGFPEIPLTEAAANSHGGQILVAEISSFQLEWIHDFRPNSAIVTNVSDDHLNRYDSFEEYRKTKLRVFENMGDGDTAAWHSPDILTQPPSELKTLRFGAPSDYAYVDGSELMVAGKRFALSEFPFTESHNFLNAMAAVLLAMGATGASDPEPFVRGIQKFAGLTHRMQRIGERGGILVINNSMCTNPAAVVASSRSLPQRQHLLVGGVDKDMDFSPLAEYLRSAPHEVYLFGSDAEKIARQLDGGSTVFTTLADAFAAACSRASSGEVIMLAPGAASLDQFADFRDRGEAFTAMAKEWLEK